MIHVNVTSHTLRITRHASSQWRECNLVIGSEFGPQVIGNEPGKAARLILHVTGHTSHITRQTSHVTRHRSHVTGHMSHVPRHTLHVTRYTSDITHHTSQITHPTSHITRHTSHITHHNTPHLTKTPATAAWRAKSTGGTYMLK